MQLLSLLSWSLSFLVLTAPSPAQSQNDSSLWPQIPSWAPEYVPCPANTQFIRSASQGLNPSEAAWVAGRKPVAGRALIDYLSRLQLEDFDVCDYANRLCASGLQHMPILSLAISGGGFGSAYTGSGVIRALDNRLPAAVDQRTGGLLQSLTYLAGLSGGSFPTVGFSVNNFPTADAILDIWQPEITRPSPDNVTNSSTISAADAFSDVGAKFAAGFNITIADWIGRYLSYEFAAGRQGGNDKTWSGVTQQPAFASHQMPLPLLQMGSLTPDDQSFFGVQVPSTNATQFEMTPYEFGSWDSGVQAFTPTQYLGTQLQNGTPVNSSQCVRAWDRAGTVIGLASAAYNFWYIEIMSNGTEAPFVKRSVRAAKKLVKRGALPPQYFVTLVDAFSAYFGLNLTSVAYGLIPNAFSGVATSPPAFVTEPELQIADDSETGQTIPLWGLIQPERTPSMIIAWDDSQETTPYSWQNGTNLYNTYLQAQQHGLPFPKIPPPSTFVYNGYYQQPAFFGCDPRLTTTGDERSPIVLYGSNTPYSAYTNYSFLQSSFSRPQMNEIYLNSFNYMTQGNGTLRSDWAACMGCAAIERSRSSLGLPLTNQCQQCFAKYCWDGTEHDGPMPVIDIPLILPPHTDFNTWTQNNPY